MDDIAVRVAIGVTATVAAGAAIVLPNDKQKESSAYDMYDKPYRLLLPNERKAVDFRAGHKRWTAFVEDNVYSWTRKLPGHDNPITNPYRGPRSMPKKEKPAEQEGGEREEGGVEKAQ